MIRPAAASALAALALLAPPLTRPAAAVQDPAAPARAPDSLQAQDTTPPPPATLAVKEPEAPNGPLPPGSRYVFDSDSIRWSGGLTLADLLRSIPGVFVARAGFWGLPEYVFYAGRGPAALEIFRDGVRMEPVGTDTLFVDPGRISLAFLQRVEVEVLPASLRVYLVTARHRLPSARSGIDVLSGDLGTGAFSGIFQYRWRSGVSVTAAGEVGSTDGASGPGRNDYTLAFWAQVGWIPRPNLGALYQIRSEQHERDPVAALSGAAGVPERFGNRTDIQFSVFAGTHPSGLGFRTEGGLAITSWSPDSGFAPPDQRIRRAYVDARYAETNWSVAARGTLGDQRTLSAVEGRVGWAPVAGVVLSGDGRLARHDGDRTSRQAHGALGLYGGPLSVVGEVGFADAVRAPALAADTAVRTFDMSARLGLDTPPLSAHVGVARRDAYAPLAPPDLAVLARLTPSAEATYLLLEARLRPLRPLTISGWYADPLEGAPADLQPPSHVRGQITFRSKFWKVFRSGAFDLKVEAAIESWGAGRAGLGVGNAPIAHPAATLTELLIEFQIAGFTGFWNMRNAGNAEADYVPGLDYPLAVQTFGVKWVFAN